MNQGQNAGFVNLGGLSGTWSVVDTANFQGGRTSDVLWENSANGEVAYWNVINGQVANLVDLGSMGSNWSVQSAHGHSDFFGAGYDDVLWRDANTGDVGYWSIAQDTLGHSTNAGFVDLGVVSQSLQIQGTDDLLGTGTDGILWRDVNSGDVTYWEMSGGAQQATLDLGVMPSSSQIVGTADLFGTGHANIIWEDTSGNVGYSSVNANGSSTFTSLGSMGAGWQIAGTGDYLGNGSADILWRNTNTGDTGFWSVTNSGAQFHDIGVMATNSKPV
jgi:hypothetical protein